ncbi:galactarate dehydratase [Larsenimonas salina]|uniref:galactarate dehydratase n=1 Tax=Larsenimonas salina TaxID=1295565 RepID=UPI00207406F1|nr:galactarate dehydratase [Larsenimonas salina]MCM5704222.1 galactarate dehydratase [Larsenimonas salina]
MTNALEQPRIICIHPSDNVAIVVTSGGLRAGTRLPDGLELVVDVPQGHKVALSDIAQGQNIIRYGEVIGTAVSDIARGEHVNESNVQLPTPPALDNLPMASRPSPALEPLEGYTFEGYRNVDGSVGTKNVLGITTSVQCVAGTLEHVVERIKKELLPRFPNVDDVVGLNHSYGCGVAIGAPAAIIPIRTLTNLARNPNFGCEIMVLGLGCEKLQPSTLVEDQPVKLFNHSDEAETSASTVSLQDESFSGFSEMIDGIMRVAERHLQRLDQRQRETCPVSDLVVGMQCGGSDAFSGVTANPAVGHATDLLVRAGASVMFSEVTEVRDAIHLLTPRAVSPEVAQMLIDQMAWYDDYLTLGHADRSANPSPGNKKGGLSNVVEKALGSVIKSGNSPIVDVIGPGERLRTRGLTFAATPASDFICGTLQAAAGMNLQVFTTGRGTPYNLAMTPVIKVSSNTTLSQRWHDLIDLDAGRIATGEATIEETGRALFDLILEVASGRTTVAAEKLGLYNDLVLFNPAPVT